ncbi:MAG: NlpC/P60 family protein [Candidatus Aminicenantes bacterium]|nr:NlpC/P60 family protein [Candidatus Aminicenantes bacterium]
MLQLKYIRNDRLKRSRITAHNQRTMLLFVLFAVFCSCRKVVEVKPSDFPSPAAKLADTAGYSIQVGAFARVDNAVRMTEQLREKGIEAFYFRHESGLYKVRFGQYPRRSKAEAEAGKLVRRNIIPDFFIINPEISGVNFPEITGVTGGSMLRNRLVETAVNYHGLPYCWGGTSPEDGFDCSGLAIAVYNLNGLSIPRTCRDQYRMGERVSEADMLPGDLVFFDIEKNGRVSHVGIYIGSSRFIHAPSRNQTIRTDSLLSSYFQTRLMGIRRYVR